MNIEHLKSQLAKMTEHISGSILVLCTSSLMPETIKAIADMHLAAEKRKRISVVEEDPSGSGRWFCGYNIAKEVAKLSTQLKEFSQSVEKLQRVENPKPKAPKRIGKQGLNSARNRVICKGSYC